MASLWRNLSCLPAGKKAASSFHFSWDIEKISKTCYFGYFGHAWLHRHPKIILSPCKKLSRLSGDDKDMQDMQASYFGYFGHAWIHTPKMIVSTCRKLWCLSACLK